MADNETTTSETELGEFTILANELADMLFTDMRRAPPCGLDWSSGIVVYEPALELLSPVDPNK